MGVDASDLSFLRRCGNYFGNPRRGGPSKFREELAVMPLSGFGLAWHYWAGCGIRLQTHIPLPRTEARPKIASSFDVGLPNV